MCRAGAHQALECIGMPPWFSLRRGKAACHNADDAIGDGSRGDVDTRRGRIAVALQQMMPACHTPAEQWRYPSGGECAQHIEELDRGAKEGQASGEELALLMRATKEGFGKRANRREGEEPLYHARSQDAINQLKARPRCSPGHLDTTGGPTTKLIQAARRGSRCAAPRGR